MLYVIAVIGITVYIIAGICPGSIVSPRYNTSEPFGWDPCFNPENKNKTFGEMTPEEKHDISHRSRALTKLKEHFSKNTDVI